MVKKKRGEEAELIMRLALSIQGNEELVVVGDQAEKGNVDDDDDNQWWVLVWRRRRRYRSREKDSIPRRRKHSENKNGPLV